MLKHIKNYHEALNIYPGEVILCEVCGRHTINIHHVLFRSQGGGDEAGNLIALCTGDNESCHDKAHGKIPGKMLTRETLFEIVAKRK